MEKYKDIYLLYSSPLYGYIRLMVEDEHKANGILADIFVYAFKHLHLFEKNQLSFYSWLIALTNERIAQQVLPNFSLDYMIAVLKIIAV